MIQNAFVESLECIDGEPTENARVAYDWLAAPSCNWTRIPLQKRMAAWGAAAPPASVRKEYIGTFSWCCDWLGMDEDDIQQHGLPPARNRSQLHVAGLPAIRAAWAQAKRDYQEQQRLAALPPMVRAMRIESRDQAYAATCVRLGITPSMEAWAMVR